MSESVSLQQLKVNEWMLIDDIVPNPLFGHLDDLVGQRLADLGFAKGMVLAVVSKGLFNQGPYAVRLSSNMQFSLRQSEASKIIGSRHQPQD